MPQQIDSVAEARQRGFITPAQENVLRQLQSIDRYSDQDLVDAISSNKQQSERPFPQKIAAAGMAGLADVAGLPGDVINAFPEDAGLPPMYRGLPTSKELISGAENLTGLQINPAEGDRAGFTENLTRMATSGGVFAGRKQLGNLAASAVTAGGQAIGGAIGGPEGELAGGLAGAGAALTAPAITRGLATGAFVPFSAKKQVIAEKLSRAERNLGGLASVATVAPQSLLARVQSGMEAIPGSAGYLHQWAEKVSESALSRLVSLTGTGRFGMTPARMGGYAVLRGVDRRLDSVRKVAEEKYTLANKLVADKTRVIPANNLAATLQKRLPDQSLSDPERAVRSAIAGKDESADQANKILEALLNNPEGTTYRALDDSRKALGQLIDSNALISDPRQGFIKQLYGAISKDLMENAGSPEAKEAIRSANTFWQSERAITDKILSPLIRQAPKIENVFRAAVANNLKDTSVLEALTRDMSKGQKAILARAWVSHLGRLPDEAGNMSRWTIDYFVNQWKGSSAKGKKILLGASPRYARAMDDFVDAMVDVQKASKIAANPSGTAGKGLLAATIYYGLAGAALGEITSEEEGMSSATKGLMAGAGVALTMNWGARLLTNPSFVAWAAQAARSRNIASQMARLNTLVQTSDDPQFVNDVDTFIAGMASASGSAEGNIRMENPRKLRYGNE